MKLLNHNDLQNVCLTFMKGSIFDVSSELKERIFTTLNEMWQQTNYNSDKSVDLPGFCSQSVSSVVKCLIWQPDSVPDWVVFITNMPDGWPTLWNFFLTKYDREIISVRFTNKKNVEYPIYEMEFKNNSIRRTIQLLKDYDKWKFFQEGPLLTFENIYLYKNKKISERFSKDIIIQYLKEKGIDISDVNFWISKLDAVEFSTYL